MTRMIVTLDGLWFRNVLAAVGPEKALAMDIKVFQGQFRIATRVIRERFGLDGNSRRDKAVVLEQMARLYGHDFEIIDEPGAVTMRLHRCAFLDALRAAGRTDHDCRVVCRALRPAWFDEIEPRTGVYGFQARYNAGETTFYAPSRLSDAVSTSVADAAVHAHRALGNMPQALTHVALVNTARNLARSGGPSEHRSRSTGEVPPGGRAAPTSTAVQNS